MLDQLDARHALAKQSVARVFATSYGYTWTETAR
jgi:hypothetical protein